MSHLEGPYLRFSEISNSSNSAFFSETDFLIIFSNNSNIGFNIYFLPVRTNRKSTVLQNYMDIGPLVSD